MSTESRGSSGPSDEENRSAGAATCYRHRDRETWLRCSRCDRPICPDCMHEAAVGFQCPDCLRAGNRTVRQARTVFGGRVRESTGVLTWTLIGINAAAFVAQLVIGPALIARLGMQPAAVAAGEWWRLASSAFLHSPSFFLHIVFNMLALSILGRPLETLLGRLRFLTLYMLAALGGSALIYLTGPLGVTSIGASGAIFGLFGATFIVARRLNLDTRWIVGLLVINLIITFTVPGIGWRAHIGGLVTGLVLALAYAYAPRSSRTAIHLGASVAVFAVIVVMCAVATMMIGPYLV